MQHPEWAGNQGKGVTSVKMLVENNDSFCFPQVNVNTWD